MISAGDKMRSFSVESLQFHTLKIKIPITLDLITLVGPIACRTLARICNLVWRASNRNARVLNSEVFIYKPLAVTAVN